MDLHDRKCLITGAAGGIGRATALAVAANGGRLVLTDVQAEPLRETVELVEARGGTVLHSAPADLTDHDAVAALARDVHSEHGSVDVVMNIAGISTWGPVELLTEDHWRRTIEVNLMGPIHVIEELVPPMIEAGRGGQLVNVSSAAGIIAMPWHAAYSATKFGIRGISEVLRYDLRRHRIGVTLVAPGGVDTGLVQTIRIAGVDPDDRRFRRARKRFQAHAVSPERAAEAIWKGVRRNKYWVYTSADIRLVHLLQRYFPPGYVLAMRIFNWGAHRVLPAVDDARRSDLA